MIEEESWKEELPSPSVLDWEDLKDQVIEDTDEEEETDDEEDNKVRLIHEPTGLTSIAEEYKTRSENLELARDRMVDKIREQLELEEEKRRNRGPSMGGNRRGPTEEPGLPSEDEPPSGPEDPHPSGPPDPRPS